MPRSTPRQDRPGILAERSAGGGQDDAATDAIEQRDAVLALQCLDRGTGRRRCAVRGVCAQGQMLAFGDCDE
ncbi:hypothetical protein XaFJ1_GM002558 [Xanthomonas albilineans]|nr:hypothetical protein XaFJ1_GM002558 [Xanthomonas albilineans]